MPDKTITVEITNQYSQEADTCDSNEAQYLTLKTEDGGGGLFVVMETERWAMDKEGINILIKELNVIQARIDEIESQHPNQQS